MNIKTPIIGSTTRLANVHTTGDYYGKGHFKLHAHEGDGLDGTVYIQARDYTESTSIALTLRTTAAGVIKDALYIKPTGEVGIGSTTPESLLQIGNYDSVNHITIPSLNGMSVGSGIKFSEVADFGSGFFLYHDTAANKLKLEGWASSAKTADIMGFTRDTGLVGIGTINPANPLAVNRSADGVIVDFESADIVEGNVSIAGTTTSYNAFMGSHYTQLKDGQAIPPIGTIVIATGEIIPCEANIEVPVMERYYEDKNETSLKDSIEDNIIKEEVDTGRKQTAYVLINGKVIKTQIPVFKTIERVKGKKLKDSCSLDKKTGKIYNKIDKVLTVNEEAPANATVLERQKEKAGNLLTEVKTKEVSGIKRKEYFSYIELASQKADKRVYGVYHAKLSDNAKGQSFGVDINAVHQIAALGLYKVRVTDTNGNIAAGDYIQSSIRAGEGEKQDNDILHNYTVAKSIISVNWNEVTVDSELGYKWQLIPATLHCG